MNFFVPNWAGEGDLAPRKAEREWQSLARTVANVTRSRRVYCLRYWRAGRPMEAVVGQPDPFAAQLMTVAIFAAGEGYVLCCRSPGNPWGTHVIPIEVQDIIDAEDFDT